MNIGDQAIAFDLLGVDDNNHSLDQYSGKDAVAVVFSCNHCPYVLAWEDRMIAIQKEYAARGVQFILIGANNAETHPQDDLPHMKTHAAEKGFPFPYLRDESQEIARAYGAERTPEVFVFNKNRQLAYHGTIDDNYEQPDEVQATYLRDALDAVLAGTAPATAETQPVGCTIKWK